MSDRLSIVELTEKIEQQLDAIDFIIGEASSNQQSQKVASGLFHAVINCTEQILKYKQEIEDTIRKI